MAHSTPAAPVVNVCSGEGTTIGELAELMMAAVGRRVPILSGPARPGDIRYSLGVPDRAAEVLNWRAETEFADGLARLLAVGAAAGRRGRRLG